MEAHSLGLGDSFYEVVKKLTAVALAALFGMFALTLQDGDELRTRLEESALLADALEDAAEEGRPRAVTVGQESTMVRARTGTHERQGQGRGWMSRLWCRLAAVAPLSPATSQCAPGNV